MIAYRLLMIFLLLVINIHAFADNNLLIQESTTAYSITLENILSNKNLQIFDNIEIQAYPGKRFKLKVIKLCALLKIPKNFFGAVKITAKDDFFAHIDSEFLDCSRTTSTPYIVYTSKKRGMAKNIGQL